MKHNSSFELSSFSRIFGIRHGRFSRYFSLFKLHTLVPTALGVLLALSPGSGALAGEALRVVASILPVHSLVSGVMQGVGSPSLIVRSYGSPHTYRMRPSDAVKIHGADLIFRIGNTLETFLHKSLSSLPASVQVVSLMETDGLTLLRNREGGAWEHNHFVERHSHTEETDPNASTTATETLHLYNPHIWLDPENAGLLVQTIARHLSQVDPVHANQYKANADTLLRRMAELAERLRRRLSGIAAMPYLVFHDAYPYLEARYGLQAAGAVTANPNRMPSARRIADLRSTIKRLNIRCIFREPQFDAKLIETALHGTDVTIGILDPLGVDIRPGPDLWFRMMDNHADVMVDCLSSGDS